MKYSRKFLVATLGLVAAVAIGCSSTEELGESRRAEPTVDSAMTSVPPGSSSSAVTESSTSTTTVTTTTVTTTTAVAPTSPTTTVEVEDAPFFRRILGTLPLGEGVILKSVLDAQASRIWFAGLASSVACDPESFVSMWAWTDPGTVRVLGRVPGEAIINVRTNALGEVAVGSLCGGRTVVSTGVWVGDDLQIGNSVVVDGSAEPAALAWRGEEVVMNGWRVDTVTGAITKVLPFDLRFPGIDTFGVEVIPFSVDNYCEGELYAPGLVAVDDATQAQTFWKDPSGGFPPYQGRIAGGFSEPWFSLAAHGRFAYVSGTCGEQTTAFVGIVDPDTQSLVSIHQLPIPDNFHPVPRNEVFGPDIVYARDDGSVVAFLANGTTVLTFDWAPA